MAGEDFIEAALDDLRHAKEMLGAQPELAGAGLYSALVLGDVELRRHWSQ